MGFFSWKTQNTGRSIANSFSQRETFPVIMLDNKGNKWIEEDYEGYGVFGGKDFYQLVAEMNGKSTRYEGIDLFHSNEKIITPNLYEITHDNQSFTWIDQAPENCEFQGYFYEDDNEDDYLEEEEEL